MRTCVYTFPKGSLPRRQEEIVRIQTSNGPREVIHERIGPSVYLFHFGAQMVVYREPKPIKSNSDALVPGYMKKDSLVCEGKQGQVEISPIPETDKEQIRKIIFQLTNGAESRFWEESRFG